MAVPKMVWTLHATRRRVVLAGKASLEAIAEEAVVAARRMPIKPDSYDKSLAGAFAAPRSKLLTKSTALHFVVSSTELASIILKGPTIRRSPLLGTLVAGFHPADWGELLLKLRSRMHLAPSKARSGVKGLTLELIVPAMPEFPAFLGHCADRLAKASGKWVRQVFVVRGAVTAADGLEAGDYLLVAFDNLARPKRMWVIGVVESKSEHNAISLIFHKEFRGFPGEMRGQAERVVERAKVRGIDLSKARIEGWKGPNPGLFGPDRDSLVILHETTKPMGSQTTDFVGVIPPDTPPDILRTIDKEAPKRRLTVWQHPVKGADASSLALELLDAFTKGTAK